MQDEDLPWTRWAEYMLHTGTDFRHIPKNAYDEDAPAFVKKSFINKDPMFDKIKLLLKDNEILNKFSDTMDDITIRRLIQLCHPDKNNGSPLSVEITQWLNQKRKS
jgi:hypothetical protein